MRRLIAVASEGPDGGGGAEEVLRSVIDALPETVAVLDGQGTILGVNEAWRSFAKDNGYTHPEAGVGESYLEVCRLASGADSDEAVAAYEGLRRVLASEQEHFLLTYPCHSPERRRWFNLRANRVAGPGPACVVVAHENVTVIKEVEVELRKLAKLAEASPTAIVMTDRQGKIEYVNPAFTSVTGYGLQEAIGKNPRLLGSGVQSKAFYESLWTTILGGRVWKGEFCNKRKSGELYWQSATIAPTRDAAGKVTHFVAAFEDVSDRRRVEAELQEQAATLQRTNEALESSRRAALSLLQDAHAQRQRAEAANAELAETQKELTLTAERLTLATRAANIGVWDWDVLTDELVWDQSMHRVYGTSSGGRVGAKADWIERIHAEDRASVARALERALSGDEDFNLEFRVLWPDARERFVKANATVQRDTRGEPVHMLGTTWDITEAKSTEAALRRAKELAEAATRAKSAFLASMSHEIRTPMNAVLGNAQLLQRDASVSASHRRHLEVIERSGTHLLGLLNDILEMSKIEAGRTTLAPKAFDLAALLEDCVAIFREQVNAKGLLLELHLDPTLATVIEADPSKVRQVVINLLSNAVKFTDSGRIDIRASSRAVDEQSLTVTVVVEDTGCGIEPDFVEKVFDSFEQSESGTQRGGTGLGMAISSRLARLMNGALTVESTFGVGSRFTFTFAARSSSSERARVAVQSTGPTVVSLPPVAADLPRLLGAVPAPLLEELRRATASARFARLTALIDEVEPHSAAAAAALRRLADDFDYEALIRALQSKGPS